MNPCKTFIYKIPSANGLEVEAEYYVDSVSESRLSPDFVVIETLAISGKEISGWLETLGVLQEVQDKIAAAIVESLREI